ncbi:MAG: B12-binding domain-containing protein [Chloroflexales bacterium]|nr:B12-binding domain-containing protein [Chloroflexales bacterium]
MSIPPFFPATTDDTVSLCALVDAMPNAPQLRHPADALMVIGRQLELIVQADRLVADVALGTLRFSFFRLHQGRITQLAAHCRSITVYGLADVDLAPVPGVTFVPLSPASPLCHEWFVVVDSPDFWGALLTRAVPNRAGGVLRRYLFEGALTADEQIVRRATALLGFGQHLADPIGATRHSEAHYARWGRVAYALGTHPEAERLALGYALGEFPALRAILAQRNAAPTALLAQAGAALEEHHALRSVVAYRRDGAQLVPVAWSAPHQPPPLPVSNAVAPAFGQSQPLLVAPADVGLGALSHSSALLVAPLVVQGRPWGALVAEQPAATAGEAAFAGPVIAAAALLGQLLPPAPAATTNSATPTPFLGPSFSAALPTAGGVSSLPAFKPATAPLEQRDAPPHDHSWPNLQSRLFAALAGFDSTGAEQVWAEACGVYPAEALCSDLLMPVQVAMGEAWHSGQVSVAAEHYASRFVQLQCHRVGRLPATDDHSAGLHDELWLLRPRQRGCLRGDAYQSESECLLPGKHQRPARLLGHPHSHRRENQSDHRQRVVPRIRWLPAVVLQQYALHRHRA